MLQRTHLPPVSLSGWEAFRKRLDETHLAVWEAFRTPLQHQHQHQLATSPRILRILLGAPAASDRPNHSPKTGLRTTSTPSSPRTAASTSTTRQPSSEHTPKPTTAAKPTGTPPS